MFVVEINSVKYGSTGTIARELAETVISAGGSSVLCVPRGRHNGYIQKDDNVRLFGSVFSEDLHIILSRLTGRHGRFSYFATRSLIRFLRKNKPDVIHLHNLHNSYINIPLLFKFIRKNNIPVVWTFHDCWPFTGHCPHFSYEKCFKWQEHCFSCEKYKEYPISVLDNSKEQFSFKKKWFLTPQELTIVAPSEWLQANIRESFFKEKPVEVIHHGVDLKTFRPVPDECLRKKYGIAEDTKLVLGVAMGWSAKKGLDVFVELAKRLDAKRYQLVLVGTDEKTDRLLPPSVISIHRTENREELAALYSAADVFVNPTREEMFGLVNIEALACGTPGVTFNAGGSPECYDETCGSVVDCDDVDALENEIIRICEQKPYTVEQCVNRAGCFEKEKQYREYLNLYERIIASGNQGNGICDS